MIIMTYNQANNTSLPHRVTFIFGAVRSLKIYSLNKFQVMYSIIDYSHHAVC